MTNEQLHILLSYIHDDLIATIAICRDAIAKDRTREMVRTHTEPSCPNLFDLCCESSHYAEVEADDPVAELYPLDGLADALSERIDLLRERRE